MTPERNIIEQVLAGAERIRKAPAPQPDLDADHEDVRLAALDLRELALHQFKQREQLLAPWLHSQDLAMIFAGRGIGKTHLALGIAFAVATGGTFARWQAPRPAKVLYLDGELPGAVLQRRLAMHLPDVEPAPGFLRVFTPDLVPEGVPLPDLSTTEGQYLIDAMIEDDTALIVIDNLSAWCRTGRENEAESWHPIASWILGLRRRGMAVLLIHHAGKGGQPCLLGIVHSEKGDRVYANLSSCMKLPKGFAADPGSEPLVHFDLDAPDWQGFAALSPRLAEQIAAAPEFARLSPPNTVSMAPQAPQAAPQTRAAPTAPQRAPGAPAPAGSGFDDMEDDIPF